MHETSVAQGLLTAITSESEKYQNRPVSAKISCGTFNAVNDEVLKFAFEAVAKGTVCEGTRLFIEHKPIQAECSSCGEIFGIELANVKCPCCNSEDFKLLPDEPLILEEIEFKEDENDQ